MKYAIVEPADQSIVYVSFWDGQARKRGVTTLHEEALLLASLEEAQDIANRINQDRFECYLMGHDSLTEPPVSWAFVEEIEDEEEFRSREPIW